MILIIPSIIIQIFLMTKSYLFYVHMFQLNSYVPKTQLKWLKNNYNKKSPFLHKITDVKKKLVFTSRVKRLTVTFTILVILIWCSLFYALCQFFPAYIACVLLFLLYFFCPFIILLANFINKPIEKSVNNYYINDAKNILNSHGKLTVIGITGSFGKTSTKYFLNALLNTKYETLMTPQNYNTTLGVVRTIRGELKPTHEIFVCEMGARNVNDIQEICDLVKPKMGVLTSIGEQHLESFLTVDNIIKTKFELIDALPDDGLAFLNYDNDYIKNKAVNKPVKSYSLHSDSYYFAKDVTVSNDGTSFTFCTKDGLAQKYYTKLIGEHNVLNLVASIGVCHSLGMNLESLVPAVKKLESVPHRLELKKAGNMSIIDDAYNSNPSGAKMAVDALSGFSGRRIIITPGMVELGDKEYELNRELGTYLINKTDEVLLVGKEQTKAIYDGLMSVNFENENVKIFDKFDDAFNYCKQLQGVYDKVAVLIENDLPDNY